MNLAIFQQSQMIEDNEPQPLCRTDFNNFLVNCIETVKEDQRRRDESLKSYNQMEAEMLPGVTPEAVTRVVLGRKKIKNKRRVLGCSNA